MCDMCVICVICVCVSCLCVVALVVLLRSSTIRPLPVSGCFNGIPWFNSKSDVLVPTCMFDDMELTMLGTVSSSASPWRNVTSAALRMPNRFVPTEPA
jgi:hypothetical protein